MKLDFLVELLSALEPIVSLIHQLFMISSLPQHLARNCWRKKKADLPAGLKMPTVGYHKVVQEMPSAIRMLGDEEEEEASLVVSRECKNASEEWKGRGGGRLLQCLYKGVLWGVSELGR